MTKAIYIERRKSLFGVYGFRGIESIMVRTARQQASKTASIKKWCAICKFSEPVSSDTLLFLLLLINQLINFFPA